VNFLLAADGRYRMSTVTAGCSTPETIDLYHQCSREPSAGYVCRNTWTDDHDGRTKYVVVTALHRHETPRRFCVAVTGGGDAAWPSSQQSPSPTQWIASSETCVRPYAAHRTATHGKQSTHLAHNVHNLHINSDKSSASSASSASSSSASTVAIFNTTSGGQCTGVEAAILDSRRLYPSSSSASSTSSSSILLALCYAVFHLVARWR